VGSGLGKALSLTVSNTWAQIVEKIKSIVNCGAWSGSISSSGGSIAIPAGIHSGFGKVTGPTLAGLIGSNVNASAAGHILSGYTAYGKNGVKLTGSDKGYNAGYTAGQAAPLVKTGTFTTPGKYGSTNGLTTINVGFTPNLIILYGSASNAVCVYLSKGLSVNCAAYAKNNQIYNSVFTISGTSFTFAQMSSYQCNREYQYLAAKI